MPDTPTTLTGPENANPYAIVTENADGALQYDPEVRENIEKLFDQLNDKIQGRVRAITDEGRAAAKQVLNEFLDNQEFLKRLKDEAEQVSLVPESEGINPTPAVKSNAIAQMIRSEFRYRYLNALNPQINWNLTSIDLAFFSMMFRNLNTEHPANHSLFFTTTSLRFENLVTIRTGEEVKPDDPLDTLAYLLTHGYQAEG